jgi:hypothetical protein
MHLNLLLQMTKTIMDSEQFATDLNDSNAYGGTGALSKDQQGVRTDDLIENLVQIFQGLLSHHLAQVLQQACNNHAACTFIYFLFNPLTLHTYCSKPATTTQHVLLSILFLTLSPPAITLAE